MTEREAVFRGFELAAREIARRIVELHGELANAILRAPCAGRRSLVESSTANSVLEGDEAAVYLIEATEK